MIFICFENKACESSQDKSESYKKGVIPTHVKNILDKQKWCNVMQNMYLKVPLLNRKVVQCKKNCLQNYIFWTQDDVLLLQAIYVCGQQCQVLIVSLVIKTPYTLYTHKIY